MLLKGIVYVVGLLLCGIWGSWGAPVQTAVSLGWCGVRGRTLVTRCAFFFSWNKGLPCISSAVFALLLCGTPAVADGSALSSGNMVVVIWQAFFFSWFYTCESFYCLFIFYFLLMILASYSQSVLRLNCSMCHNRSFSEHCRMPLFSWLH